MSSVKGTVSDDNRTYDVITLREALSRRGFPLECLEHSEYLDREADNKLVGWNPDAKVCANVGGEFWSFCSGAVLFSFCEVELWNWTGNTTQYKTISRGWNIVVDGKKLKLVSPG